MPKRLLWLSRHRIRPEQRNALKEFFDDDVIIERDSRTFEDADDIQQRFESGKYDDLILTAPVTLTQKLLERGIQPIRSNGRKQGSRYHFYGFERITDVNIVTEPIKKAS